MYKDFKKSQTLDTGFSSGSGLIWMFSGIVLGLIVGLGMYLISNDKIQSISMIDSLEKKIQKAQTENKPLNHPSVTVQHNRVAAKAEINTKKEIIEERKNKFSYHAVLPNLDVPLNSAQPINTSAQVVQTIAVSQENKHTVMEDIIDETNVAEEVTHIEEVEVTPGNFLLQVASFKKESMAEETRVGLTNQGIDAHIQKKKVKGHYWYRVVAGPVDQNSVNNWKSTAEKLGHKPLVISVR